MQRIKKSVGKGGKNEEADVKIVQELLNKFAKIGGYSKLKEDGRVGDKTLSAIAAFQQTVVQLARPDKLVDTSGNTIKKLNENPSAVAKEAKENESSNGGGGGKGKVNGVGKDIVEFLEAVAGHYGKEIKVTSGLRDKKKQADVMWRYWTKTLNRGQIYKALKSNSKLRKQLDDWWTKAIEDKNASSSDKAAAEKSFKQEIEKIAGSLSLHLSGRAVDVSTSVDKKVFTVLKSNMNFVHEKNKEGETTCYHFDSKSNVPKVSDAMKAKWPAK
jgi:hypothetical protein